MRSLQTPRLHLVPQCAEHAQALFDVLADPRMYLHEGEPPQSLAWLRERLTKLETRRSADGSEQWLNWVVMMTSGRAVGYVQATVQADGTAYVAYMFGSAWWGQGLASEAVSAMMDELAAQHGATRLPPGWALPPAAPTPTARPPMDRAPSPAGRTAVVAREADW